MKKMFITFSVCLLIVNFYFAYADVVDTFSDLPSSIYTSETNWNKENTTQLYAALETNNIEYHAFSYDVISINTTLGSTAALKFAFFDCIKNSTSVISHRNVKDFCSIYVASNSDESIVTIDGDTITFKKEGDVSIMLQYQYIDILHLGLKQPREIIRFNFHVLKDIVLYKDSAKETIVDSLDYSEGNLLYPNYEIEGNKNIYNNNTFYLDMCNDEWIGKKATVSLPEGFSLSQSTSESEDTITITQEPLPIYSTFYEQSVSEVSIAVTVNSKTSTLTLPVNKRPAKVICKTDSNISNNTSCYEESVPNNWYKEYVGKKPVGYKQNLADLGVMLSFSVYNENFIKESLHNLGFHSISYKYLGNTVNGSDACFGIKTITDSSGNNTNLVIIVIRGTIGEKEWIGNFITGEGDTHASFSSAAGTIKTSLEKYISDNDLLSNSTMIYICGHSRGAAVSNILAHNISNGYKNVTAYTFATPNTTSNPSYSDPIYNFKYANDVVGYVPQGYYNHGTTYVIGLDNDIPVEVSNEYRRHTGRDYKPVNQNMLIGLLIDIGQNGNSFLTPNVAEKAGFLLNANAEHGFITDNSHSGENYISWVTKRGNSGTSTYQETLPIMLRRYQLELALLGRGVFVSNPLHPFTLYSAIQIERHALELNSKINNLEVAIVQCPVDVFLINSDGNAIASIVNHVVQYYDDQFTFAIAEDEMCYLIYPMDEGYHLKIDGTDEGAMDIIIQRIGGQLSDLGASLISAVPLSDNSSFTLNTTDVGIQDIVLISDDGKAYYGEDHIFINLFALPASLKVIDEEAFMGAPFEKITIPNQVELIGSKAFANCVNLKEIVFENGDLYVADDFLYGCPENIIISAPEGSIVAKKESIYRSYLDNCPPLPEIDRNK